MSRDITQSQFQRKIDQYGFKPTGYLGYYQLPAPHDCRHVSALNAGPKRRAQLSYLLDALRKAERGTY